ncbi:unnamed protein product [Boreogadus saida]
MHRSDIPPRGRDQPGRKDDRSRLTKLGKDDDVEDYLERASQDLMPERTSRYPELRERIHPDSSPAPNCRTMS